MTPIAATILSGNSAGIVSDAVLSIVDWVDFVLLIDTGITDDTCRIVEQVAGEKFRTVRYPWQNDFAAARNFALQAAAEAGATWALTLDTDERLSLPGYEGLQGLREKLNSHRCVVAWLVPYRKTGYAKERFVRLPTHLTWRGRTHEALVGAGHGERQLLPGSQFSELPKTPEQIAQKHQRDLTILQAETELQPKNPRWWYYLGQTLAEMGRQADAVEQFQKCAFLDGWDEESAWACYRAGWCLHELGNYKKALEMCAFGLARHSGFPELPWLAGLCCLRLGQFEKAVWWAEMAASLGCCEGIAAPERRINFRHLPAWYEAPYDVLRAAHRRLENSDQVERVARLREKALDLRLQVERQSHAAYLSSPLGPSGGAPVVAVRPLERHAQYVAVLGLYGSGSTATANVLNCLGVNLGREFFRNYFEAAWLAEQLRGWWEEPNLLERVSRQQRVTTLANWLRDRESEGHAYLGAKHPLLSLCGPDLQVAWGPRTRFIWTWRPLAESIASLQRRGWWPGKEETVQTRLWNALEAFFASQEHLRIEFASLLGDPQREVDRLIDFLGLQPTQAQRAAAARAVKRREPTPFDSTKP
ncbi:MAG: glycosyltransferase [Pirellulaceae bacterium]